MKRNRLEKQQSFDINTFYHYEIKRLVVLSFSVKKNSEICGFMLFNVFKQNSSDCGRAKRFLLQY